MAACSTNNPSPTAVLRAAITVGTDPNPVPVVSATRLGSAFSARFKVVIREIAGQGGEVQAVTSTLYEEASGAIVGLVTYDTSALIVFVGEKRVEANGTLEVPIQIDYTNPSDATVPTARLHVLVNLKDDRGNIVSSSALVRVQ
jgi:hypothetical protein